MAKTHYFPSDQVHFTLGRRQRAGAHRRERRHRRRPHARRQRRPDRARLDGRRHRRARLGPRLPAGRADRGRRRRSPATRWPSRCSTCTPRAGAGPRSCPGSGCWPTTSPMPTCGSSTSPRATSPTCARTSRSRSSPSWARWASAPRAPARSRSCRPGRFGGNMDTRQLTRGTTLYLPVQVDGALFSCGDAHARPGRRRGLRDRPRVADVRRPALHAAQGPPDPRAAVPHRRAAGPARGRRAAGTGRPASAPTCSSAPRRRCARWSTTSPAEHGLSPEDAYLLCSLCVDLRISEIVDAGEYVVSALLPLADLLRRVGLPGERRRAARAGRGAARRRRRPAHPARLRGQGAP